MTEHCPRCSAISTPVAPSLDEPRLFLCPNDGLYGYTADPSRGDGTRRSIILSIPLFKKDHSTWQR